MTTEPRWEPGYTPCCNDSSPLDPLRDVVRAVKVPVQAVGGFSREQAVACPRYVAPLVVLGAPLTIDADAFKTAEGDLGGSLRTICKAVHGQEVAMRNA